MPKGNNSNTTDKLVIDIKVNVKKGATTQITNLTKSLTKLNEVVKKTANIEKYANALRTIGKELTRTTKNKGVAQIGNQNFTEQIEVDVPKQKQQTEEIQKQEEAIENITRQKKKQLDVDKKSNKENQETSGFLSKFARSIGRIALYRAIRASLSGIVNMFKEGLVNLRAFDKVTDSSFKKMELSATTFKNSIASLATGIIQSVQPYITNITDAVGHMVNRFNEAQAVLKGESKYMKVLTSDTKEWQEQVEKGTGNLLEFDKFLSLNEKDSGYTGFTEEQISVSNEEAMKLQKTLEPIRGILQSILDVINSILSVVTPVFIILSDAINGIVGIVKGVVEQIAGMVEMVGGLLYLLTGDFDKAWEHIANGFAKMINGIANMFIGLVNFWIAQINLLIKPIDLIVKAFGGSGFQIGKWNANVNWQPYADGGMVEKGTQFIAGEAGAEVVHTSARGTGVTNIEQFSQAMLQALATYGVARGSDVSFKGDVYIDRTKAGQLLEGSVFGEGVRVGHFKRV